MHRHMAFFFFYLYIKSHGHRFLFLSSISFSFSATDRRCHTCPVTKKKKHVTMYPAHSRQYTFFSVTVIIITVLVCAPQHSVPLHEDHPMFSGWPQGLDLVMGVVHPWGTLCLLSLKWASSTFFIRVLDGILVFCCKFPRYPIYFLCPHIPTFRPYCRDNVTLVCSHLQECQPSCFILLGQR